MIDPRPEGEERSRFPSSPKRLLPFSSLRNRNFRWFWLGVLASFNSMQMQMIAQGWLVYTMTNSSMALGMVTAGLGLPMVLCSLHGGAIADRVRKRDLLLITRSGMALVTLVVTILISTGAIAFWHLLVSSILSGLLMAFYMPARQAFVLEVIEKEFLLNALAMNATAMNICRVGSPALAGVLLKIIGTSGVYWIVTLSSLFVVFSLIMLPRKEPANPKQGEPVMRDVLEGLRYVRQQPILFTLLLISFVPIATAMPYQALMPVFAKTVFGAGETALGLLMSAVGVGALFGSTLLASFVSLERKGLLMLSTGIVFGVFLILFGFSGSLFVAILDLFFVGGGSSMYLTLNNTLIMGCTAKEVMGRVQSIYMMTFGFMPLAAFPAGALAEAIGAPLTVAAGGAILVVFLMGIALLQPRIRHLG